MQVLLIVLSGVNAALSGINVTWENYGTATFNGLVAILIAIMAGKDR